MTDTPEYQYMDLLANEFGEEPALLEAMVGAFKAVAPEWDAKVGSTEMLLLEGFATTLGLEIMALRMVDGEMVESLMGLYGVTRDPGLPATGKARLVALPGTPTVTVPEGTILRYVVPGLDETVDLETLETATIITSTSLTATVAVRATDLGTTGNGTPAGSELFAVGDFATLDRAEVAETITGGADPEDDDSFLGRAAAVLSRQTSSLVLPEHFQLAAMETPGVGRSRVLDLYNPATPGTTAPGNVSVVIADALGEPVSASIITAVKTALSAKALASVTVHVLSPTYTTVGFVATVKASADFTLAEAKAAGEAALRAWLSPTAWPWSTSATTFDAAGILAQVPAIASVTTITGGATLAGPGPMARPGTITVTAS